MASPCRALLKDRFLKVFPVSLCSCQDGMGRLAVDIANNHAMMRDRYLTNPAHLHYSLASQSHLSIVLNYPPMTSMLISLLI